MQIMSNLIFDLSMSLLVQSISLDSVRYPTTHALTRLLSAIQGFEISLNWTLHFKGTK